VESARQVPVVSGVVFEVLFRMQDIGNGGAHGEVCPCR